MPSEKNIQMLSLKCRRKEREKARRAAKRGEPSGYARLSPGEYVWDYLEAGGSSRGTGRVGKKTGVSSTVGKVLGCWKVGQSCKGSRRRGRIWKSSCSFQGEIEEGGRREG